MRNFSFIMCTPYWIQTNDPDIRSVMLYSAELREQEKTELHALIQI